MSASVHSAAALLDWGGGHRRPRRRSGPNSPAVAPPALAATSALPPPQYCRTFPVLHCPRRRWDLNHRAHQLAVAQRVPVRHDSPAPYRRTPPHPSPLQQGTTPLKLVSTTFHPPPRSMQSFIKRPYKTLLSNAT